MEHHATVPDRLDGRCGEWLHVNEPLVRKPGLHDRVTAVAVAYRMHVVVHSNEQPGSLEVGHDPPSRLVPVETFVRSAFSGDRSVRGEDVDLGQPVPLPDLEVVGIMGRRHLDSPGAERRIHVLIGHDGDLATQQRQYDGRPDELAIPLIVGMHRYACVSQHRLGPGRGDHHMVTAGDSLLQGIAQVPEVTVQLLVLDLDIGQSG